MKIFRSHGGDDLAELLADLQPDNWDELSRDEKIAAANEILAEHGDEIVAARVEQLEARYAARFDGPEWGWQRRDDFTDMVNEGRDLAGRPMDAVAAVWADATSLDE